LRRNSVVGVFVGAGGHCQPPLLWGHELYISRHSTKTFKDIPALGAFFYPEETITKDVPEEKLDTFEHDSIKNLTLLWYFPHRQEEKVSDFSDSVKRKIW